MAYLRQSLSKVVEQSFVILHRYEQTIGVQNFIQEFSVIGEKLPENLTGGLNFLDSHLVYTVDSTMYKPGNVSFNLRSRFYYNWMQKEISEIETGFQTEIL